MNIALIGYRGTGKSAVAQILAIQTEMTVVSLDEQIVKEAKMSIPKIVEQHGWDYFRDIEQQITQKYALQKNLIIDCGGGVILRKKNVDALRTHSTLVWLTASAQTIASRISTSTQRPALVKGKTFLEEIEEVLVERTPLYQRAAHYEVSTQERTPTQIAQEVLSKLRPIEDNRSAQ